jgi:serine/threonine protein kinase
MSDQMVYRCSAFSSKEGKKVAIKKITPVAKHVCDAKHALREIILMRHMGKHENIITLHDLIFRERTDEL